MKIRVSTEDLKKLGIHLRKRKSVDYELYCEEHQIPAPSGLCPKCGFVLDMQSTYLSNPELEARIKEREIKMPETPKPLTPKLGKKAPKIDPRTLKLAKYLPKKKLSNPPVSMGYWDKVGGWPMMLNDQLGDCTCAAAGHMIEQWTDQANAPNRGFTPSDSDVLTAYEAVGGYVPNDPSTDNGAFMLDVLNYWRKTGIGGHKILAFASVNPMNQLEMEQAIWLFGNLYIGAAMPISAQSQSVWQVPATGPVGNGSPGSWGGHCIPAIGYNSTPGKAGVLVVSWGQTFPVTWNFLREYADEMYAVLSTDWMETAGVAPNEFNLNQLMADLSTI